MPLLLLLMMMRIARLMLLSQLVVVVVLLSSGGAFPRVAPRAAAAVAAAAAGGSGGPDPRLDVAFDLPPRPLGVLRRSDDLEHRVLVPSGRHDVRLRVLLDALDRRSLRPDDESHDAHRDPHPDRHLATTPVGGARVERRRRRRLGAPLRPTTTTTTTSGGSGCSGSSSGPDLAEVIRGRDDLPLGGRHVVLSPGDDEDRLLSPHRGLDVGVRLAPKGLDLAPCPREINAPNVGISPAV